MRRFLLILLACMAFLPLLPTPAHASHAHAGFSACCPVSNPRDAGVGDHGCIGCATAPEATATLAPRPRAHRSAPVATVGSAPTAHRPGLDPPPPRAAG